MIPFGIHTVTLYHKDGSGYTKYVLTRCSWRPKDVHSYADNALTHTVETTCRFSSDMQKPSAGDLFVLGECTETVSSDIEASRLRDRIIREGGQAFRATAVSDNANGAPLPHYAATGV